MIWKITAYNGTWIKSAHTSLYDAVDCFLEETGLCMVDIKLIENIH